MMVIDLRGISYFNIIICKVVLYNLSVMLNLIVRCYSFSITYCGNFNSYMSLAVSYDMII